MFLLVVQVLVPIGLLLLLAVGVATRITKLLRAAAVFFYLMAVHLAGLWLDLPWWTPWVFWALYGAALWVGWPARRKNAGSRWVSGLAIGFWGLVGAASACLMVIAALARVPPAGPVVELASPLPPGRYLVVNGGNRSLMNGHFETLEPRTARQAAHRGQSYGVDIVGLTPLGQTSEAWQPRAPERYAIFGTPVLAPCAGQVAARLDGRPDMPVPIADEQVMAGNHVVLRCGSVQVLLAHMRKGSVAVQVGQLVRTGQKLGEVGNSGNTGAPHLHIHAQEPGRAPHLFAADPLPIRIGGRYLVRGDRL